MSSPNVVKSSKLFTLFQINLCITKVIECGMVEWLMSPLKQSMENIFTIEKGVSTHFDIDFFRESKAILSRSEAII